MPDVTHLIYTALYEREDDLFASWVDPDQIVKNMMMLENLFEPLAAAATGLQHVSIVHGGKAYGVHLPDLKRAVPVSEATPRHAGENFYHRQEDYIRAKQQGRGWAWTIFRPHMIVGAAMTAYMNTFLPLVVFAALRKEAGLDLPMPVGESAIVEMTDSDVIADALEWATEASSARNEIFNVLNGDVFSLHDAFPIVAKALGMPLGSSQAYDLPTEIEKLVGTWPEIVRKYGLRAPEDVYALLGVSIQLASGWTADVPPAEALRWGLTSTIKIRLAGFPGCADTPAMLAKYVRRFQELHIVP